MLELKHIKKSYDGVTILNDVNLEIEKGEIVSILGPSGCGKTTLLNLILGMTDADSGSILLEGEDITRVPMEKRGFNIVFQDYALFPNLNVYQNITYGLRNKPGISSKQEVEEFIDLLGLREHLEKKIDQLSGGQKQRTALARTMVMKPKILLLDEPLSALDGVIKESIKAKIKEIAREFQLTTIIVTHDPEEALTLSDKVLIVNRGGIAQFGRPEEIIEHPADSFVKEMCIRDSIRTGCDGRHADQQIRGAVVLPHGTGKVVRILVFAKGPKADEALAAGADFVGAEELIPKIQNEGWLDFDVVVATPDMMGVVAVSYTHLL